MKSLFKKTAGCYFLIAIASLLFTSCNDEISYVPVFQSIDLTPDTVSPGATSQLAVKVTDNDDDDLVYYHSVTGGSIIGYGDTVIWLAPDYEGTFYAGVLVTDHDGNQATDSISLVVKRLPTSTMVKGIAAFADSITFDLADAKVYLYNSLEDLENHNPAYQDSVSGFGPIVSFRFDNVPAGTYYLDIWKDMDFSNLRSIGDFLGWYGTGNISSPEPQPFLLEEGGTMYAQVRMWIIGQK